MNGFSAAATLSLKNPEPLVRLVSDDLAGHGARVTDEPGLVKLDFKLGSATMAYGPGRLDLRAEAQRQGDLLYLRMILAGHLVEHSEQRPEILWTGDGTDVVYPPNFRVMRVERVVDVTPHMRRLTLSGEDIGWFDQEAMHVRMMIPPRGIEPEWPTVDRSGLVRFPEGDRKLAVRKYTIRSIDVAKGLVDMDFVIHEAGPGSEFAMKAGIGDLVGMAGPGGGGCDAARNYLIAGDETALPAIARICEAMADDATGTVYVEIADPGEEQRFRLPAGVRLVWLHRNGEEAGISRLLVDAVKSHPWPDELDGFYAWVACEFAAFRELRTYLRAERKLPRDQHLAVAYWRRGESEDSFGKNKEKH